MLSRLVIAFLPRSKCLLISWLQSPTAMILEPKKIKPVTVSIFSPSIYHEVKGLGAMVLVFLILSFKPAFPLSSFTLIKRLLSSSSLSASRVVSSAYLRLLISSDLHAKVASSSRSSLRALFGRATLPWLSPFSCLDFLHSTCQHLTYYRSHFPILSSVSHYVTSTP